MNIALHALALVSMGLVPAVALAASAPPPVVPKCDAPEYRQFDFWVGKWDVFDTKDGTRAGSSLIELVYRDCTLRENWTETGMSGGSLNTYSRIDGKWHQTWTDSTGTWREFVGGLEQGRMVLVWRHPSVTMPGKTVQERMIFTPNPDGSVRQYSDQSIDGVTWTERYDYTYRRARD